MRRRSVLWVLAVMVVLAAGVAGLAPAAGEGFGVASAQVTTVQDGTAGVDEVQLFEVEGTGGTFTVTYDGETSAAIAFGSPAASVEASLVALSAIGPGDVDVTRLPTPGGGVADNGDDPYVLSFIGALGAQDVPQVTANTTGLTGEAPEASVVTTTPGRSPANEIQELRVRAVGGTYTVTFDGHTTAPLVFNLSAGSLQAALLALPNLDPGDVTVTGGPGNQNGSSPYTVTFAGSLSLTDLPSLATSTSSLVATTVAGSVLARLPAGARPTAWSAETGQIAGVVVGPEGELGPEWSWTPDGGYVELPRPNGGTGEPLDVNDVGQVLVRSGGGFFLWSEADGVTVIDDIAPVALNNEGAVTGQADAQAAIWTEATGTVLLGTLPTTPGQSPPGQGPTSWATAINDSGQVIGRSTVGAGYFIHSFFWSEESGMVDLGTLGFDDTYQGGEPGLLVTSATDINDAGTVVGYSWRSYGGPNSVFVWSEDGGMVDIGGGAPEVGGEVGGVTEGLPPLAETPQGCSSKFLTLVGG